MIEAVPPYIYVPQISTNCLLQGDILKVKGKLREYFNEFYPAIDRLEGQDKYAMILTQSCDLVKTEKRQPKLSHINVCLIRSLQSVIERIITDQIKPVSIGDKKLLLVDVHEQLKDRLSKLLNNTDQKTHFFLPKQLPFVEDMVAILPLSFSFKIEHHDMFLENKVLELKPEFQAKTGHLISQLYGRIGTPDLLDFNWDDKKIRDFVKNMLSALNLKAIQNQNIINYVIKRSSQGINVNVDDLIQEAEAAKMDKMFEPRKKELKKQIKTQLIRLFENKEKIDSLVAMDKMNLSKELEKLFAVTY